MDARLMAHFEEMAALDWSDRAAVVDFDIESFRISAGPQARLEPHRRGDPGPYHGLTGAVRGIYPILLKMNPFYIRYLVVIARVQCPCAADGALPFARAAAKAPATPPRTIQWTSATSPSSRMSIMARRRWSTRS
jgi:hypothetical protein